MKLTFLGGANEVGASCTLLEVAGKRILVDAGMRMQKREGTQLPELDRLQEGGAPDLILLTHAHTDHIGALPLLFLGFPQVPIYTTEPTRALTRVLLSDSLKIMESRWEQEEEIPLYPPHAVEGTLGRMVTVPVGEAVPLGDDLTATFIPSGHVLGACSITLETPEGTILFAGDYSVDRPERYGWRGGHGWRVAAAGTAGGGGGRRRPPAASITAGATGWRRAGRRRQACRVGRGGQEP